MSFEGEFVFSFTLGAGYQLSRILPFSIIKLSVNVKKTIIYDLLNKILRFTWFEGKK